MMMMMGLGRPKIRNDGSPPGPRSSSRATPLLLQIVFFSLSLSTTTISLLCVCFFCTVQEGDDYLRFTAAGDHDLLSPAIECLAIEGLFLYLLCFYSTPHACLSRNINITCSVLSTHFHSLCPKSLKVNHRCYRHHHTSQIRKKVKKRTCFLLFLNSTVPLVSVFRKWELYVCSGLCILSALGISFVTTARHRKRRVDGFSL